MKWARKNSGFTIVELLIVVVVIAILAAITIVAYNGITSRARISTTQQAVSQVAKKVMTYAIENGDIFPSSLTAVGIANSDTTTYQYRVDNTSVSRTFCVTATTGTVSFYMNNSDALNPKAGACNGHGAGGVVPITNLAYDPRATLMAIPVGSAGWKNSRWFGSGATGNHVTVTGAVDGPVGITSYLRKTWTTASGTTSDLGLEHTVAASAAGTNTGALAIEGGKTYTLSSYIRSSVAYNGARIQVWWRDVTGNYISSDSGPITVLTAGQWARLSLTTTAPANAVSVGIVSDLDSQSMPLGATLDGTGLMITEGSTLRSYADGTSTGWAWNGSPNAASSSGPPL